MPAFFRSFGFLRSPAAKISPNDRANMLPSQVTFSVNLVDFSVKMKEERAKSLTHHLRQQLPEPLPESPRKRAGIVAAYF
jgi:hypothetical protein